MPLIQVLGDRGKWISVNSGQPGLCGMYVPRQPDLCRETLSQKQQQNTPQRQQ